MQFDTTRIRADEPRRALDGVLLELGLQREPLDLWTEPTPARVKRELLVVGDLTQLTGAGSWAALGRLRARGVFRRMALVGLVRTHEDELSLARPEVSLRLNGGGVLVCEMKTILAQPQPARGRMLSGFFREVVSSLGPDRVREAEYSELDKVLWLRFGDGLRRALPWDRGVLRERFSRLRPESARVSDRNDAVLFLDSHGREVEVDAAALRALVDPSEQERQRGQALHSSQLLGERLRAVREARTITQEQLAVRSGIPQPSLSRIEKGVRYPKLDTLRKYAEGVGVSLSELLADLRTGETR